MMEQAALAVMTTRRENNSLEHKKVKVFQAGAIAKRKMGSGSSRISDTRGLIFSRQRSDRALMESREGAI